MRLVVGGFGLGIVPALAMLLAGCSSPEPVLYTIATAPGPVQAGGPKIVLVQQIAIAHFLERSQIVRSSENYRLDVMSNDWWGEPLAPMLNRVLVEELGQRLPQSTVIADNGAVSARPDATVEVNIQRLDEDAAGNLVLQAQAGVRATRQTEPELRSFRFSVAPPAPGISGEVAAITTAVGRLADGIAAMLTALSVRG
ncbi:MAG: membrane integrity-associated transporter subunit PqiC [Alphaproteobacteria bacterium]|nr:membrane integrity-associated transporter subunit PqiC [Alphaproteobacteria bacterium]